jgi:ABC-type branched-subunit amino acid transport system permease subunit
MFTLALAEMFFALAKSGTFRDITGAEDGLGFREVLPDALNPTPTFDGSRLNMYRITIVFFVIVFLAIRPYRLARMGYYAVVIVLALLVGLILGDALAHDPDIRDDVYSVADLWDLFLGIVFVIVVMVLPLGIVGTWNKLWIDRRVRQMEKRLQKEKEAAVLAEPS